MESTSHFKFINKDWIKTNEGELAVQQLYSPKNQKIRRNFGLLERPNLSPEIPEIPFKIGVVGKAGSGKTRAVSLLCGKPMFSPGYIETLGIHVKNLYWPAQIKDKTCMFKLQFWESGESCSKRFHYISTACLENADAVAIVVNNADRSSLEYAENKLQVLKDGNQIVVLFVMLADHNVQIPDQELSQFATTRKLPSFHLPSHVLDMKYLAPFYNSFCDFLYSTRH